MFLRQQHVENLSVGHQVCQSLGPDQKSSHESIGWQKIYSNSLLVTGEGRGKRRKSSPVFLPKCTLIGE